MSCHSPDPPAFCSDASPELKLYQAFIFSVPVFFTFVLLLLFYLFYLRRQRANWASIRMRVPYQARGVTPRQPESGIKKEVRELLPVVVFKESFLIRETQCSVCLGEYKSDERLKKIPPCGHTFHVECIDSWLTRNITCPLCRASLIPTHKQAMEAVNHEGQPEDLEGQVVAEESQIHEEFLETSGEGSRVLSNGIGDEVMHPENETVCSSRLESRHHAGENQSVSETVNQGV